MNCQACPYQKQIDDLRRRCLACNPDSTGGRPHGAVVADDFTLNNIGRPVDFDREPSAQATNLSEDDENKLRIAMSSLFGLDPIDLLLVQHLVQGGSLDSFLDAVKPIAKRIVSYRGQSGAVAWYRKKKLVRTLPILMPVLKTDRKNDAARKIETEICRELSTDVVDKPVGTPER